MATNLTDDAHDIIEMTTLQKQLRNLAEQHGYIVGLIEGLDQMPGTLPNPIRSALKFNNKDEKKPAGAGDPTSDGAPPPPDGGAPDAQGGTPPPPM